MGSIYSRLDLEKVADGLEHLRRGELRLGQPLRLAWLEFMLGLGLGLGLGLVWGWG